MSEVFLCDILGPCGCHTKKELYVQDNLETDHSGHESGQQHLGFFLIGNQFTRTKKKSCFVEHLESLCTVLVQTFCLQFSMFRCFARGANGWSWCIRGGAEEISNHSVFRRASASCVKQANRGMLASEAITQRKKRNRIVPLSSGEQLVL